MERDNIHLEADETKTRGATAEEGISTADMTDYPRKKTAIEIAFGKI